MLETQLLPDFIVVDGAEGGTGAAPLEFVDHVGTPLQEGLLLVHNALVGLGLRERIKLGCSGKIVSAFDIARAMALGADWCNSARCASSRKRLGSCIRTSSARRIWCAVCRRTRCGRSRISCRRHGGGVARCERRPRPMAAQGL
jgi:glutamate synthase domain-containing protein 2